MNDFLRFVLCSCFFTLSLAAFGQDGSSTIYSIEFEGLKKTKASYLSRFLKSEAGTTVDLAQVAADVQRLKNMEPISHATYSLDTTQNGIQIRYHIQESKTLTPIINFGGIRGNFWFQLGFKDFNWQGTGQTLAAFYQNTDRRHNFNLFYQIPYFKASRWGGSFSLSRWASIEPLYFTEGAVQYRFDIFNVGLSSIYEINHRHNLQFGLSYFYENYEKAKEQSIPDAPGPQSLKQPKSLLRLAHQINRINYHFFYLEGWQNQLSLQSVYTFKDQTLFNILVNETRYFKRIGHKGNFAARLYIGISTNNDTPFAPFVVDSHVNIRGSGNRIDRGTAAVVVNLEYRHTFFNKGNFAGQLALFTDQGNWRGPGGELDELVQRTFLRQFMGGGLRIIRKNSLNTTLRIDFGFDIQNSQQKGLVFGFGQYF